MPYVITRTGNNIKAVEAGGEIRVFTTPALRIYSTAAYPQAAFPAIEIKQGSDVLQLQVADITSINGVAQATIGSTLPPLLDALLAIPSGNLAQATNASGAVYNAFGSQVASQVTVFNGTGTAIDVQRGGSGAGVSIGSGLTAVFVGLTNTNQIGVRRTDQAATPVTVGITWQA